MKNCHNSINKAIGQLTGLEVLSSISYRQDVDPIYHDATMILITVKNRCKICGDEYSFLVGSTYVEKDIE